MIGVECGIIRVRYMRDWKNLAEKEKVLSELLGGKGKNLWITAPFFVDYVTIFILETIVR